MNLLRLFTFNSHLLLLVAIFFAGCSDDDEAIPAGELKAEAGKTNITAGESIVFTDNSTEAKSREWIFEGGTPATSTEKSVAVTFENAGTFEAKVEVAFLDGTTKMQDFAITVDAPANVYEVNATVDTDAVEAGQSVVFTDDSEGVKSRAWTFDGGDPATATDQEVTVAYAVAGEYDATLEVTFEDDSKKTESFHITVTGVYEEKVTVTGDTYVVYSESPTYPQATEFKLNDSGLGLAEFVDDAFEGSEAIQFGVDPASDDERSWAMMQVQDFGQPADISGFAAADGYLNVAIKSLSPDPVRFRIEGGGKQAWATVEADEYGFTRDGEWQLVSIPLADVLAENNFTEGSEEEEKEGLLKDFSQFRLRSDLDYTKEDVSFSFTVDMIFFSVEKPTLLP